MSLKKERPDSAGSTAASHRGSEGLSDMEKAAMQERARELKEEARRGRGGTKGKADGESDVLAKIAEMEDPDRDLATRLHALILDLGRKLRISPRDDSSCWWSACCWAA